MYYVLFGVSMNKITLWKNVRRDDWTAELAIIASNDSNEFLLIILLQIKNLTIRYRLIIEWIKTAI